MNRGVCKAPLRWLILKPGITVSSHVFAKEVQKGFYLWCEARGAKEERTKGDRLGFPERQDPNQRVPNVAASCRPQRQNSDAKSINGEFQAHDRVTGHDTKADVRGCDLVVSP